MSRLHWRRNPAERRFEDFFFFGVRQSGTDLSRNLVMTQVQFAIFCRISRVGENGMREREFPRLGIARGDKRKRRPGIPKCEFAMTEQRVDVPKQHLGTCSVQRRPDLRPMEGGG